jgi:hypothetical protein
MNSDIGKTLKKSNMEVDSLDEWTHTYEVRKEKREERDKVQETVNQKVKETYERLNKEEERRFNLNEEIRYEAYLQTCEDYKNNQKTIIGKITEREENGQIVYAAVFPQIDLGSQHVMEISFLNSDIEITKGNVVTVFKKQITRVTIPEQEVYLLE